MDQKIVLKSGTGATICAAERTLADLASSQAATLPCPSPAAVVPEEQQFILSNLSPSGAQKRLAVAVVLVLLVAFVVTAGPLSTPRPGRIGAFIPAYSAALFASDLITAFLVTTGHALLPRTMGLSICRSIIEAHEGRIRVAPTNPRAPSFSLSCSPTVPVA